jgi:hypothetical protein
MHRPRVAQFRDSTRHDLVYAVYGVRNIFTGTNYLLEKQHLRICWLRRLRVLEIP